jgi:hypothetical protein
VIVISGALVLVALVLLVIGLVSTALSFVYASIAVSVVSFAFLLVGILQRRGEQLPDTEPGTASPRAPAPAAVTDGEELTAIIPAGRGGRGTADATDTPDTTEPAEPAEPTETVEATEAGEVTGASRPEGETAETAEVAEVPEDEAQDAPGRVLVVAGRPRYHAASCRYLTGKDADEVEAAAARAEGFTACGVCKPDETSPAAAPEPAAAPRTRKATAKATAKAAPATRSTATRSTATRSTAAVSAPPAKTAPKAPAKTTAATGAAASPRRAGSVVVIPDRGRFHRAACRYVRDVPGAQELTKAQATRQGYDACGVCKP